MNVTLNGAAREIDPGTTVAGLLALLDVRREGVAVERNRALVPKAQYDATELRAGDVLEIVTLVGGG